MTEPPRPFFGRIESLRGIGAVAVAAYHMSGYGIHGFLLLPYAPWAGIGDTQNIIGKVIIALLPGHAALMMFFAISGCVLHVSLQYGPKSFGAAAIRFGVARIFRIYPIVIFGTLVGVSSPVFVAWLAGTAISSAPPGEVLANMMLLKASVNSTLWALQVEVLMAPVILLLFFLERACGTRTLLAIGLITTVLSFDKWWAVWPPLSNNFYAFVLGMLIPTLGRDWVTRLSRRAAHYLLLAALIVLFGAGPALGFYSRPTAVFETCAAVALLSIVTFYPDIRGVAFLDHWAIRLLGASSGSYYVLHMPLIPLLVLLAAAVVPPAWSAQFPVLVGTGVIALSLCALVPVCLLSYRLVEATGIAVGRRVLQCRKLVAAPSAA